jgi:hypothetical protein
VDEARVGVHPDPARWEDSPVVHRSSPGRVVRLHTGSTSHIGVVLPARNHQKWCQATVRVTSMLPRVALE